MCLCMFAVDVHALLVLLMCFYMFVVEVHGIWSTTKMHLVAGPSAFWLLRSLRARVLSSRRGPCPYSTTSTTWGGTVLSLFCEEGVVVVCAFDVVVVCCGKEE